MKPRLLAGLLCVSLLALASTLKAQSSAQDFVYFGKELELSKLAGQEIDPLDKLITQILKLAPEEKLAPALENLTKRMSAGSVVAPKAMTLEALEATRSLLVAHNAQITSDAELKSLDSQLEFYKKAIENDVLTITVSSERAPHQPLDMGDAASTGNVGETFEPISASGFVLPDDVNIVHNLTVGNDMTIGGNLVINDTVTINGTLELPTGYVTTGGDRYINDFGATSFFAGVNAGNTAANNNGINNTGIGYRALTAVTFGFGDTGIGANALPAVTTGFANTAIGSGALQATITAKNNTAVGASTLFNSNTDNNTALGSNAGLNLITGSNNIYIGYNEVGSAAESNTIRIGANATLAATQCFIGGIDGTALTNQAKIVGIDNKQLGTTDASGFTLGGILTASNAIYADGGVDRSTAATTLSVGTTNATTVTIGNTGTTTMAVELPNGYVTTGGSRYINKFGTTSFFAGKNAGNTALLNTGANNTGVGEDALNLVTGGDNNSAFGKNALAVAGVSGCSGNCAFGSSALETLESGSNNVAMGYFAGSGLGTGCNNNILIGYNEIGSPTDNNVIRIGINSSSLACYLGGIRGVTTGNADAIPVLIDSNGQLGTVSSARRYKENIQPLDSQDRFMALKPVTFNYKTDDTHHTQYGFVAEEVETIYPELTVYNKDGQIETVAYHQMYAILTKEIQTALERIQTRAAERDLQTALKRIEALEAKLAVLEN